MLSNLSGISPVYRRYPNMKGMARLRVSRDAKESVWRSVSGRNLMISQRRSRGNSGENFDGDIVVDGQGKDDNTMEASESGERHHAVYHGCAPLFWLSDFEHDELSRTDQPVAGTLSTIAL